MIKYVVEFIGTFLFLSVILRSGAFGNAQPFVIVSGLLAAILFGGAISGGHFNPAVSVMMHMKDTQSFNAQDLAGYVVAQVLGGLLALKMYQMVPAK
jgi:glycerol uptake facilitator-like aquaporin